MKIKSPCTPLPPSPPLLLFTHSHNNYAIHFTLVTVEVSTIVPYLIDENIELRGSDVLRVGEVLVNQRSCPHPKALALVIIN